jgi:ABC-2 type transport system permease protein
MATKTAPESPDGYHSPFGQELAPSALRADDPGVSRLVGMVGLFSVIVGVAVVVMNWYAERSSMAPRLISTPWGYIFAVVGLGGLLLHAARDADMQIRRTYGAVGGLLVLLAIILSFYPVAGVMGGYLLPGGVAAYLLGLVFLLAFAHHEDDLTWRRNVVVLLTAVGAALALTGLIGGNITTGFLVPYGVLLAVLGIVYLSAVVTMLGADGDLGYRLGLALGVLGGLVFLVGLGRSIAPAVASGLPRYLVPNGLLLMTIGLLYVALSIGVCSERQIIVLTRRELAAFFYSPIAYIVLFGMTFVGWIMYWFFVAGLLGEARQMAARPEPIVRDYIVSLVPVICVLFVVPVLTMRLLSEERRTGTIEVMFTAPVDEISVVLSKFIAALIFYLVMWIPWALFLVGLRAEGGQPFDYLPLLSFYVALVCSGAAFVAMGLFFSSLTRNQIISAVLSFAGMMFLLGFFLLRQLQLGPNWTAVFKQLSFIDLWIQSLGGMLYVRDLVLWLSMAAFWLFLTVKVLEARKWK